MNINFIAELVKALYQADYNVKLGSIKFTDKEILISSKKYEIVLVIEDLEGIETLENVLDYYNEVFRGNE